MQGVEGAGRGGGARELPGGFAGGVALLVVGGALLLLLLLLLLGELGSPSGLVRLVVVVVAPLALLVRSLVREYLLEAVGELVGVEVAHGFGGLAGRARLGVGGAEAGEWARGDGRGAGHAGLHFGGGLVFGSGVVVVGGSGDALVWWFGRGQAAKGAERLGGGSQVEAQANSIEVLARAFLTL